MAFGFDLDGILAKLAESPQVKDAMNQFTETRNGIITAMQHFNTQLETIKVAQLEIQAKCDRILFHLEHPSDVAPAGDDGLLALHAGLDEIVGETPIVNVPEKVGMGG